MDLILWRHAEAEDEAPGGDDLQRALTPRGEKQAARVAAWLDRQLTDGVKILCSPALRCEQTVAPLGRKYKVHSELAPGTSPKAILEAAGWPDAKQPVLVVGHQPVLGEVAALLLEARGGFAIRKGAVWWFRSRDRGGEDQNVLVAAISPDTV
ncbi:SixA phosphatase family protein [Ramlibacter sp. PS4R-6]|uniref:SixA phosphatase family protein n=1 Tax=Ramlibacter sp. PS4R-6 TaxID=3133438 RepID=UPI0030958920